MKAVLFRQHGGPEVLEYAEFPTPSAGPGEALIRLHAAALNRMDIMVRNGWPGLKLELPHINGADGAGEITALGEGTTSLRVGDHVVINANLACGKCEACLAGKDNMCSDWHLLGETVRGTYAQYVALPVRQLYKLPPTHGYHAAAAAALVYQTAWHSLATRGKVAAGEIVGIVGAGGGVNSACIQVAKYLGARVAVIASNAEKLAHAEKLGAEILIDRAKHSDWSKELFAATDRRGVDVIVDNVGTTFPMSLRALRRGGRLLTVGNSGGPRFEIDNRYIFAKHLTILGSTMSTLEEFTTVMDLIVAGKLQPIIDSTYALKDAAAAQDRLWHTQHFGKITLDIP